MKRTKLKRVTAFVLVLSLTISLVCLGISDVVEKECPIIEHQHTDECYLLPDSWELACEMQVHRHTDICYDESFNLVCGYSDKIIHTHDENCYSSDGELVCELSEYQEHIHTADCYSEETILVCEENVVPHDHTDDCYEEHEQCVCGQVEDEAHVHVDKCYQSNQGLVCEGDDSIQEHVHIDACYSTTSVLVCGEDDHVMHTHAGGCYGANGEFTCGMLETVIHQHDSSCFTEVPSGRSDMPLCGLEEHIHSDTCCLNSDVAPPDKEPVEDNKPVADDELMETPDSSIDNAVSDERSMSAQYCVVIRRIMSSNDVSSRICTIQQISGNSVMMPAVTSKSVCDSTQVAFDPITFLSEGEYTFKVSFTDLDDYYILRVNVVNDAGIFRLSATYTQMPDGTVNETGAVFYDQVVELRPAVKRIVTGTDIDFEASYKITNLNTENKNVIMPVQNTIQMEASGIETFPDIKIYRPGEFIFSITEIDPITGNAIIGTNPEWFVVVTATEENGELQASYVYRAESNELENTSFAIFKDMQTQFVPVVSNVFIGKGGTTQFCIKEKTESPYVQIPTEYFSLGEGNGQLPPIAFRKAGVYDFTIQSVSSDDGYKRDTRAHSLTVTVKENGNDGLQAEGTYSVSGGISYDSVAVFINVESKTYGWSSMTELKANRLMSQMSLEEKVGQLFLLHYSDNAVRTVNDVKKITEKYHPGGYIVFQPDLESETPSSFRAKIAQTQKDSKIPLIISIDEEGGKVNRASNLPQYRDSTYLGPQDLKASGGLAAVTADGIDKAGFLKDLGVNLNHAPVADVADTGYIYARTWGGDGLENADYVTAAVSAMEGVGMGTTLKHFPGYGSTSSNTHNGFAVNYLSEEDFQYNDLLPFHSGMASGSRSVMVTHNTINYLDPNRPASLSPAVYNLLRNEIGFDGLAITDDLNMKAVTEFVGDGNQSLEALKAGADMALVPYPDKQIPPVLAAVESGELPLSRIEESCLRVLCWKIEHGLMDDISDFNQDEIGASIPVKVIIDGIPTQVGEVTKAFLEASSYGSVNYRIALDEVFRALEEYGFGVEQYMGSLSFGTQNSSSGDLVFSQTSINKIDGKWMLSLPENASLENLSIIYAAKPMVTGSYKIDLVASDCGFYSVRVNDVAGAVREDLNDVSSVQYFVAGASTELTLPHRNYPLTWIVSKSDNAAFSFEITTQDDKVTIQLNNICSPIIITSGAQEYVNYTVQYYGLLDILDKSSSGVLDIIDTSGGILPQNGVNNTPKTMKLTLNSDGTVKKTSVIKKLYSDETFRYRDAPDLSYIDKLQTFDSHYIPIELWVLNDGADPQSTDRKDWKIYNKDDLGLSSFYDLSMTNIADGLDSPSTVVLKDQSVIRILYTPAEGTFETPVDFWDYDITDGYIYSNSSFSAGSRDSTSSQSNSKKTYAKTNKQGINNPDNYSDNGAKFAFGNANTGTGLQTEAIEGMYFNQYNRINGIAQSYKGCFFGLAKGLDEQGNIIFNDQLSIPDLFGTTPIAGKTSINGYSLQFNRVGDTYTLEAVKGTSAVNLSSFSHPQAKYQNIWTNNFWPMDSAPTFGADGHDLMFGSETYKANRLYSDYAFPPSDDTLDHNSYFGMHFTIDFSIPKDYCGDLEYCFFGDDDIWMFLDGKLVLDIGGCHSSVGEYVNLWDYINPGDTTQHRLQFYYLERGASGSTCWIQYTIPSAKIISGSTTYDNSLKILKTLIGNDSTDQDFAFEVKLNDKDGNVLSGDYPCITYNEQGEIISVDTLKDGRGRIFLSGGSYAVVRNIPDYTTYHIIEDEYNCDTYIQEGKIDLSAISGSTANSYEKTGEDGTDSGEKTDSLESSREITGSVFGGTIVEVNCVNVFKFTPILPETGGPGRQSVNMIGVIAVTAGFAFFWFRKKRNPAN